MVGGGDTACEEAVYLAGLAKQVYPPLSSVTVYTEEMGRTAMDVLNKQVLSPREIPTLTMLGTKLTLRESTK